ncbi:MAG TPA: rhomboid family intramembrane serine protease, partial [Chloroflexota bacterium]|nr:rhomboid family intramembrane serine protease [Chloroflexota bacterium]
MLVGDGPGVQPAIYAVRTAASLDGDTAHRMFEGLIARITDNRLVRMGQGYQGSIRVVSIFCFNSIDPTTARELAGIVPDRFHPNLKPAVWVVDLSQGKLWAPRTLGLIPTRAQAAVKRAITETGHGAGAIGDADLAWAENIVASEREAFVSTIRRNVPYVTYTLLAAIWIVFYFESSYRYGATDSRTLLHFGALQPRLVQRGEWWRLFTAMFVHVGIVHILFNSIALYSVGSMVERIYGAARYAIIYFASGLFASIAS